MVDLDVYAKHISNALVKRRHGIILSSRGCPYQCVYCHNIFGKKSRLRTPESIVDEIKYLWDTYGLQKYFIADDIFNISPNRVLKVCDLLIKSGIKTKLYFPNGIRADICTHEVIDACVEAGMVLVNFALETSSRRLQKLIKKNLDIDKFVDTVHYTCSKDIIVGVFSMVGFPTETVEEGEDTINFLRQFKKVSLPYLFTARYYPNTEMYDMAISMGIPEEELKMHSLKAYHDQTLPAPTFSAKQLKKYYLKYINGVFLNGERLNNCQKILEKHLSEEDIKDFYTTFLNKKIKNVQTEIMRGAF